MPNSVEAGLPNPQTYQILSNSVAVDEVTGLHWQRQATAQFYDWEEAVGHCESLELGDHDDWRLPSRMELISVVSLETLNPSIDGAAFPNTLSDWFWSSTPSAADVNQAWYIYFYFGYPNVDAKVNSFSVRCVRADPKRVLPKERYRIDDDKVIDQMTLLVWQRQVNDGLFTFDDAQEYCSALDLDGESWRVPSMQELQSIVDPRVMNPAIDADVFPSTPAESFWTSTPWTEAEDLRGWHVDFRDGSALYLRADTTFRVRCVR